MFSNKKKEELGDRKEYLQRIVHELQGIRRQEGKRDRREELLAHLVNFGYDPINYDYFEEVGVTALFLDLVQELVPQGHLRDDENGNGEDEAKGKEKGEGNKNEGGPGEREKNREEGREEKEGLLEAAMAGICNISLDPRVQNRIMEAHLLPSFISLLSFHAEPVVLSSMTILYFLVTPKTSACEFLSQLCFFPLLSSSYALLLTFLD